MNGLLKFGKPKRVLAHPVVIAGCVAALLFPVTAMAQSESVSKQGAEGDAFQFKERSTIDSIPLRSLEEDALANTVIEGGLAAPAAGVPVQPGKDDDFYLDPLALQPRDSRTDLGRTEVPVNIIFRDPKSIPGQTHSTNYVIRPPENRTYDTLNINMTGR
jgi:hypothetical protein